MRLNKLSQTITKVVLAMGAAIPTAQAIDMEPPKYQAIDRNLVNILTGMPQFSLTDLTIGGDNGLTHSISSSSGSFASRRSDYHAPWGYTDSSMGFLRVIMGGDNGYAYYKNGVPITEEPIRVFGDGHTHTFHRRADGSFYSPEDSRYLLERVSDQAYVMTTPEGTELTYSTARKKHVGGGKWVMEYSSLSSHINAPAVLTKVQYANGFTKYIQGIAAAGEPEGVYSITTNTGYQIKYLYKKDQYDNIPNVEGIPIESNAIGWERNMPASIVGLNNTYEFCAPWEDQCANLNGNWPKASYHWPDGMPLAMYLDKEAVFSVRDAWGGTTEYYHKGFGGIWHPQQGDNASTLLGSRVTKIKEAGSLNVNRSYYYNFSSSYTQSALGIGTGQSGISTRKRDDNSTALHWAQESGVNLVAISWQAAGEAVLCNAGNGDILQISCHRDDRGDSLVYQIGRSVNNRLVTNSSHDGRRTSDVSKSQDTGSIRLLDMPDQSTLFKDLGTHFTENDEEIFMRLNRPYEFTDKLGGTKTTYEYVGDSQVGVFTFADVKRATNGNIKKIIEQRVDGNKPLVTEAEYVVCHKSNRKYCNKPVWTKDPNGLTTHYQYHIPSGQIELVTPPNNANGVSEMVHTEYEEMYAFYKQSTNGAATRAPDPIWLKVRETSCANSQYNKASQSCAGNDKIVTEFEYDPHHNLNLVGTAVTADGKTLRTCYQYDQYGNRIGESQPKANSNVTTCIAAR